MPAILRIDVGRAYENRILHYARVNQHFLLEKEPMLRKYSQSDCRFIKAKVPSKDFTQELVKKGIVLACMRFTQKIFKAFSSDLNKISKRFEGKVYGFTKHGFKKRKYYID